MGILKKISQTDVLRILLRAIFALLVFFAPVFCLAQNYPTRHYTMRDGLPSLGIRCIYKDSRGLMWIGTDAGLCSFDGKTFKVYKSSEGIKASQIWAITEDAEGNLWFGSYGDGLFRFDGMKFKHFTEKDGLATNLIRVLCWSESCQCLVAGGAGGVSTVYGDSIVCSPDDVFSKSSGSLVTGLTDAGKFVYITTYGSNNPLRYYPLKNRFVQANTLDSYYPVNSFSVFITSTGDTVFSYNHSGVTIYKKDTIIRNESMGQVFSIAENNRGDLWMASWSTTNRLMIDGVFKYDGKSVTNYKTAFGITDKEIWTVYYDREQDVLWVGTINEGLFRIPFSGFTNYPPSFFNLKENKINRIFADSEKRIWIAGSRELITLNPDQSFSFIDKNNSLQVFKNFWTTERRKLINQDFLYRFKPADLNADGREKYLENTPFNYGDVIEAGKDSFVYVNHLGTFLLSGRSKKLKYVNIEGYDGEISYFNDTLLFSGNDTYFYPGFRNQRIEESVGFHLMRKESQSFTVEDGPHNVMRIKRSKDRTWYASGTTGLWMCEGVKLINFNQADSNISNNLNDICFDEYGHVIFGSNTGEICIATWSDDSLNINFRIDSGDGLQGNRISWLIADKANNLWVGTNQGLNCISLDLLYETGQPEIRFLDEEDGYTGQTSKRAVIDSSGNLWIGAEDQLIKFDIHSFLTSQRESGKLLLAAVDVNNTPFDSMPNWRIDPWTGTPQDGVKLRYSENNLTFYFDKLNYRNPGKDRFRYRLKGHGETWAPWSESRKAVYTNLSPGNYELHVESHNLADPQHVETLSYTFTIGHPWWGLWYLQVIFGVSALALINFTVRKYYGNKRRKQLVETEMGKKIAELEMQALQAQMNPHFIFNSINGIQSFVLAGDMDGALGYLSDFSKIVRFSLENANRKMVSLENKIEFLHSYLRLEQMRFSGKFDYEIQTNGIDVAQIQIPPMLIQPFVENAIRHGFMKIKRKGYLVIKFENVASDVLKCTLIDNGAGREMTNTAGSDIITNDRLHSARITEIRLHLFNPPGSPEKYRIVYTDLKENGKSAGLMVELHLPKEL